MSEPVSALELVVGTVVVLAAAAAVLMPRRLGAVVSLLVFGVLLSVQWALMGAPDVALAEAAIGTGVTGAIFVTVVTRSAPSGSPDRDARRGAPRLASERGRTTGPVRGALVASLLAAVALLAGLGSALVASAQGQAAPAQPGLGGLVDDDIAVTGVEHPVTAVLLNFRSYDTFLEIVVLVIAVVVVLSVSRVADRRGDTELPEGAPPPPLLTWFVRLLAPILGLLALWLLVAGTSRTGGAFQAGAVLAALLVLSHVSGVLRLRPPAPTTHAVVLGGAAAFLALAVVGIVVNGAWFATDPAWAGPVTLLLETALTLTIGVALALVYVCLAEDGRTP